MVKTQVTIVNKLGLHARAAALLVKTAQQYQCQVSLGCNDNPANVKNILDILMLEASKGSKLCLCTEGEDESEASQAIGALIAQGFNEPE